jgi:hypothetical protein
MEIDFCSAVYVRSVPVAGLCKTQRSGLDEGGRGGGGKHATLHVPQFANRGRNPVRFNLCRDVYVAGHISLVCVCSECT